jgi:putative transposase
MKLVANLKLKPNTAQQSALRETLERCNEACDWISQRAWETKTFKQFNLHKLVYAEARERFGLSAQVTVRCIAKVADSYKRDTKTQRVFREHSAQPYDDRIFRFAADDHISIWLLKGREKIPYVAGEHQRKLLECRKGEVDLIFVRGKWYISAVCDFDDPKLLTPEGVLGVDMGIVNIATDSTGEHFCGAEVEAKRKKYASRRAALQRVGTRAAKKRLRKMSGKQSRYQKHTNHCTSKAIVTKAKRSQNAIALEDLKHIRTRVKANKEQRKRLHNWGFGHLRACIEYKAVLNGVPVVVIDPTYTSQTCPVCATVDRRNRPSQSVFRCIECGHESNADYVAAGNISGRGFVASPMFAHQCALGAVESRLL